MTYQIGQIVPFHYTRSVWRADIAPPQWFIFHVKSQHELPAEAWLMRNGACEAWHPTEVRWRLVRGKRRKVKYHAALVPGYVFALLDRIPHWDVLFDRAKGKLLHVVSRDGIPLAIGEDVIEKMADVRNACMSAALPSPRQSASAWATRQRWTPAVPWRGRWR